MCKIKIKYQSQFTLKDMEDHKENCEEGAGFLFLDRNGKAKTVKDMEHKKAFSLFEKESVKSPFVLFHSRNASAGSVGERNIMPFMNDSISLAHNGTISREPLAFMSLAKNISISHWDSDSLLLFKNLNGMSIENSLELLKLIDDNFILVDFKKERIYIIGEFDHEENKNQLLESKNAWNTNKSYVTTDFNGKVLECEIVQYHTKTYTQNWYNSKKDGKEDKKDRKNSNPEPFWHQAKMKWMVYDKEAKAVRELSEMEMDNEDMWKKYGYNV